MAAGGMSIVLLLVVVGSGFVAVVTVGVVCLVSVYVIDARPHNQALPQQVSCR